MYQSNVIKHYNNLIIFLMEIVQVTIDAFFGI